MFALSAWVWMQLPAGSQVPIHWNVQGEVDGYAGKFWGLFLLPLITAGMVLLFAVIPRMEPRRENFARSGKAYLVLWAGLLLFMFVLHLFTLAATLGYEVRIEVWVPFLTGALFVAIGLVMGRMESNYLMGVRTPWTLTSELSWQKTHKLSGYLFAGLGGVMMLTALFAPPELTFGLMMVGIFAILFVTMAYSYWVWKHDPNAVRQ
jgi:uncharacterized membrane protein